jgi:hypothetical protein
VDDNTVKAILDMLKRVIAGVGGDGGGGDALYL